LKGSEMATDVVADRVSDGLLDRLRANRVTSVDQIYEINGQPHISIVEKHTSYLTPLIEDFIANSPFFTIATSDAEGNCDVSPKGDAAGVVKVLDPRTLAIPDRPGNRRVDGHRNIVENPHIGLLFFIPNVDETLRINGRCFITQDAELLASMSYQGKVPKLAMIVEIDEVYMHCARAFLRSGLWKPETWPNDDDIPTLAAIMCEQKDLPPPDETQGKRNEEYRTRLY
jgi:PPOX class probable FMN-dependent enzyme